MKLDHELKRHIYFENDYILYSISFALEKLVIKWLNTLGYGISADLKITYRISIGFPFIIFKLGQILQLLRANFTHTYLYIYI